MILKDWRSDNGNNGYKDNVEIIVKECVRISQRTRSYTARYSHVDSAGAQDSRM